MPSSEPAISDLDRTSGMTFDHLGLVVRRLARGQEVLSTLFQVNEWTDVFRDEANGVLCRFGRSPTGPVYELLEPLGKDSPVADALATRKAILNHIAYRVDDLAASAARLARHGCAPTGPARPAIAYGGRQIQFFVTPLNFIVELIEAPHHAHVFQPR